MASGVFIMRNRKLLNAIPRTANRSAYDNSERNGIVDHLFHLFMILGSVKLSDQHGRRHREACANADQDKHDRKTDRSRAQAVFSYNIADPDHVDDAVAALEHVPHKHRNRKSQEVPGDAACR